jgi:murein L,D-transpeptidase YcbB/YkuD
MSVSRRRAAFLAAALFLAPLSMGVAQTPAPAWTPAERAEALSALAAWPEASSPPMASASDTELAAAVSAMARTELGQRIKPASIERFWAIEPAPRNVEDELADARRAGRLRAWLAGLSPKGTDYRALQEAERRYRDIVAAGGWTPLPAGPVLAIGDRSPAAPALRTRLEREGYRLRPSVEPQLFDADVKAALTAFQRRHALPETGRLDVATRRALDVPAESRLDQLEANVERWRWLPHDMPPDRLEVDVGGAEATLFAHGSAVLAMKVIVGDPKHQTPMFASRLTGVVFDPPWNVPDSIASAEILPKAAKDPGYLARNGFTRVDGRLQQRPGPKNSLGLIKFDLPSPFGVYLHDTPAKALFARPVRTLSHGCMRLEKPAALAEILLAPQGWTAESIATAMAAGRTQAVPLKTTTPLFVVYRTVSVDPHGEIVFRPDPYGWDRRLASALQATDAQASAAPGGTAGSECSGGAGSKTGR